MGSVFDTKKFKKLKAEWYKKLTAAEFNDIENGDGTLIAEVDPRTIANALKEKEERDLMKRLSFFPQALRVCSQEDSPHPLANYLLLLGRQFHHFYDHHRVLGESADLTAARLGLIDGVRQVLKLGLSLLGVNAPESM